MNLLKFFGFSAILGSISSHSQTIDFDSINTPYVNQIDYIFEHTDLSEITNSNGILYEHGIPIYTIESFHGLQSDSNKTSFFGFGLAYASIYSMAIDSSFRLPHPDSYRLISDTINKHSDIIPIAILHQEYYKMDTLVGDDSLLIASGGQYYDVVDRSRSPYQLQTLFLATPMVNTVVNNTISLVFKNDLIYNNSGKIIQSLSIDMADGNGLVSTNENVPVTAIYSETGIKTITIKVSYTDGTHFYSYSDINVRFDGTRSSIEGAYDEVDLIHHVQGEIVDLPPPFPDIEQGGGDIYVSYACGHTSIVKPFIWAEAYNPVVGSIDLDLDYDKIIQRLDFKPDGWDKSLSEFILDEGYDLVVIDYDHGGDYLPRTALLIENTIKWVNEQKHLSGSNEENVLLGQSMGGMSSRYALKTMEDNNEDHEVGIYISFDSGHQGVNIPLGANHLLRSVADINVFDLDLMYFVPQIYDAIQLANLPASRTMVRYQPDSETYSYGVESLYDDYYNEQNNVLGMPENCDVIAISNGSRKGSSGGQDFASGDLILHINEDLISVISALGGPESTFTETEINAGIFMAWNAGADLYTDIKIRAMSDAMEDGFIFTIYISGELPLDLGPVFKHAGVTNKLTHRGVDAAPGGLVYPHALENFKKEDGITPAIPPGLLPEVYRLNGFCFTPTISTLNFYGETGDGYNHLYRAFLNPEDDLENNYVKDIHNYTANNTVIDDYGTEVDFKNTEHTYFTSENALFLLYHVVGANMLDGKTILENDDVYQFGKGALTYITDSEFSAPRKTNSVQSYSLMVRDDAQLLVNATGSERIGLTPNLIYTAPNLPPFTNPSSHFTLTINNRCGETDPINITIEDNAQFILGDNLTRTGDVAVFNGHSIIVRNGGKLVINKGSHLFMREGSQLIIEDGGTLIIEDQGTLVTLDESDFYYYDGAAIQLNGNDAKWEFAGQLHIMENAQFKPTHEGSNSGIIIVNSSEVAIVGETGSSFELFGDSEADELLLINDESILIADESIEIMRLVNCKVLFRSLVAAPIYSKCEFHSINANYEVQSNMIDANTHAHVVLKNRGLVTSGEFHDVILKFDPNVTMDGIGLRVMHTNFYTTYKKEDPLLIAKAGNFFIHDCEFNGYEDVALLSQGLTAYSTVSNSSFTGTHADYARGIFDYSASELKLTNSNLYVGNAGVWKVGGKLGLKCNVFHDYKFAGVFVSGCDLNMGTSGGSGYNIFSTMDKYNVYINNVPSCYIQNGFNTFDNVSGEPTIKGSIIVGGPYHTMLVGQRNKWNPANLTPSASEFHIVESGTGDPIGVLANMPQAASCGAAEPAKPYLDLDGNINSYFPIVSVTGATHSMRLDSAVSFAIESTRNWDQSGSDLTAIERLHDILMHPYTTQQLADTTVKYYLDLAYSTMKYTIGYAIMDSTILISENVNAFSTPVQYYVDVLNELTTEDTILPNDYLIAFRLELDKAHLFRMIGHTDMGLSILQNTDLCPLDSAEQSEINHWKFVFEEEIAERAATDFIPLTDTTFTDTSQYHQPTVTQIQDSYFGSVINSVSSITYRGCMGGSKAPKSVLNTSENSNLKIYPNPSNGEINIEYEIPAEHQGNLVIYSIEGKEIANFSLKEGRNAETIDLRFVQDGIYLYRLFVNELPTRSGRIIIRQ